MRDPCESLDDRLRQSGRRKQAVEVFSHHARQAGLERRWNIGRNLQPRPRGDRKNAHLAGAVEINERAAQVRRHHRDVTAGKVGDARR